MLESWEAYEACRQFLEWYCKSTKPYTYLEIGCANNETLNRITPLVRYSVGVDVKSYAQPVTPAFRFETTSDAFFANYVGPRFDLVFIDGDHSAEQVYKDVLNALSVLTPNGLIACHDTYPPSKAYKSSDLCGTACEAVRDLRLAELDISILTLPIMFGITLINRVIDG